MITLILDHLWCDRGSELQDKKKRAEKKIDSLNQVIKMRDDSIRAIENQTDIIKTELFSLQEKMQQKGSTNQLL